MTFSTRLPDRNPDTEEFGTENQQRQNRGCQREHLRELHFKFQIARHLVRDLTSSIGVRAARFADEQADAGTVCFRFSARRPLDPANHMTKYVFGSIRLANHLTKFRQPMAALLTVGRIKFNCTRKQNVVFEMNMPVQITLKIFQPIKEDMVSRTRIFGRVEIAAQTANLSE